MLCKEHITPSNSTLEQDSHTPVDYASVAAMMRVSNPPCLSLHRPLCDKLKLSGHKALHPKVRAQ